jgi:hypothetical protein
MAQGATDMIRLLVSNMSPGSAEEEGRRALGCQTPVRMMTMHCEGNPNQVAAVVVMDISIALAERLANRVNGYVTACGRRLQCHVLPFE